MLFLIDDRTLVFLPRGPESNFTALALVATTLQKNANGPLAEAIASAHKHTFAAGVHLTPLFREFDRRVPQELAPYSALLAARTAVITGDLGKIAKLNLTLKFDDATAARRAAPVLEEGIATVTEKFGELVAQFKQSRRPFEQAMAPLLDTFLVGLKKTAVKADGSNVIATADINAGPVAAKALGELLTAIQSQKKAAERMNNLKQIGLALHNYNDAHGRLPTNVYGPKGELLLSWRVQILPYLEQDNLYRQFKMDEPWDSENNKKLIEQMPKVFQAPERNHPKGQTFYQSFIGPDPVKGVRPKGVFGRPWHLRGDKTGIRIVDIHDGSSNTIAVIEAGDGVVWTKPDDLPFGGAVPPLGEKRWKTTPALRFDGSVFLCPTDLKPETFWALVTTNGGEVVDIEDRPNLGGRPFPQPPTAKEPRPNDPIKPNEAEERIAKIRDLENQLAKAEERLRAEEEKAKVAAVELDRVVRLFQTGNATQEEVEKAKLLRDQALVRVAAATQEVKLLQTELVKLQTGLGKMK